MGAVLFVPIFMAVTEMIISDIISQPSAQNPTVSEIEQYHANLRAEREARMDLQKELDQKNIWLEKGLQPIKWPTENELESAKERFQYQDGYFHLAITGMAGSGKSSLINAFRGMRNDDLYAAKTGVVETTSKVGRYPDPTTQPPMSWTVWYDFPGAGTLKVPDWQYFNDQGLFIFDLIILVVDIRFTKIDLAILENSQRFKIPTFIVRSKANQHIRNVLEDMGHSHNNHRNNYIQARNKFIADTHENIESNLRDAGLPPQKVYIVSKETIHSLISGKNTANDPIDERQLFQDLISAAYHRRYPNN